MKARDTFRLNQTVRLSPDGMAQLKYRNTVGVVSGFGVEDHVVRVKWSGRIGTYHMKFWEPCANVGARERVELPAGTVVFVVGLPVTLTKAVVVEVDPVHVALIEGATRAVESANR